MPAANVGFAFGVITAFSNLATLVGPAVTGAVRDAGATWRTAWTMLAVAALAGALIAIRIREPRPHPSLSAVAGARGHVEILTRAQPIPHGLGAIGDGSGYEPVRRRQEPRDFSPGPLGRRATQPVTKSSRGTRGIRPAAWARSRNIRTAARPRSP